MEWVSVKDRLPEVGATVIIEGGCGYYIDGGLWRTRMEPGNPLIQWKVTHWMPLPKPSTGE